MYNENPDVIFMQFYNDTDEDCTIYPVLPNCYLRPVSHIPSKRSIIQQIHRCQVGIVCCSDYQVEHKVLNIRGHDKYTTIEEGHE